jgi:hypothetical protein
VFASFGAMRIRALATTAATAALAVAALPAVASAAPVDLVDFSLSPTCTHPGGQVTAHVTVHNTTLSSQNLFTQSWTTLVSTPLEVQTGSVDGPTSVPAAYSGSQDKTVTIPASTPPGIFDVHLGFGPSASDGRSWSQRSVQLTVLPILC